MIGADNETIESLSVALPCRHKQIQQLLLLLGNEACALQTLMIYGVEATGKSTTVQAVLDNLSHPFARVSSRECITTRHLLERTLAAVKHALLRSLQNGSLPFGNASAGRCDSLSAFAVELATLLQGKVDRFVLVFDGVDRQREAAPGLVPALARLGEIIPNLTVVLVMTNPNEYALHNASIPLLHFPAYTRAEILTIMAQSIPDETTFSSANGSLQQDDVAALWSNFIAAAWDSLGQSAAYDLVSFQRLCAKLWPPFIQPVLDGQLGPREFSKLLVRNRTLLQGEAGLASNIVAAPTISTAHANNAFQTASSLKLPFIPSYLLLSAYLASYNSPRHDITLYSKGSLSKRKKRGGATLGRPPKSKHDKIPRRLLGASTFPLEQLLAIFHALLAAEAEENHGPVVKGGSAETLAQFANLVSLRLVVKGGASGGGDILDQTTKWRVNVSYETIRDVARGVAFDLDDYMIE